MFIIGYSLTSPAMPHYLLHAYIHGSSCVLVAIIMGYVAATANTATILLLFFFIRCIVIAKLSPHLCRYQFFFLLIFVCLKQSAPLECTQNTQQRAHTHARCGKSGRQLERLYSQFCIIYGFCTISNETNNTNMRRFPCIFILLIEAVFFFSSETFFK